MAQPHHHDHHDVGVRLPLERGQEVPGSGLLTGKEVSAP